jgi:SAM-dependent methyltransferase
MPESSAIWRGGDAYERYVGRWSRLVAREFLAWLVVPPGCRWLDVGCGTGAPTAAILEHSRPAAVLGVDPSDGFLAQARAQLRDPRARFLAGTAGAVPVGDSAFDVVAGCLMLNHVPEPRTAVADFFRVVRTGGIVAAYVLDYANGMQVLRRFWDAATELDPAASANDEGSREGTICAPPALTGLWVEAGLGTVETRAVDIATRFRDVNDTWHPFLGGQGVAPAYVSSLDPARSEALRDRLRTALPVTPDGSISLPRPGLGGALRALIRLHSLGRHGRCRRGNDCRAGTLRKPLDGKDCSGEGTRKVDLVTGSGDPYRDVGHADQPSQPPVDSIELVGRWEDLRESMAASDS